MAWFKCCPERHKYIMAAACCLGEGRVGCTILVKRLCTHLLLQPPPQQRPGATACPEPWAVAMLDRCPPMVANACSVVGSTRRTVGRPWFPRMTVLLWSTTQHSEMQCDQPSVFTSALALMLLLALQLHLLVPKVGAQVPGCTCGTYSTTSRFVEGSH